MSATPQSGILSVVPNHQFAETGKLRMQRTMVLCLHHGRIAHATDVHTDLWL